MSQDGLREEFIDTLNKKKRVHTDGNQFDVGTEWIWSFLGELSEESREEKVR